MPQVREIAWSCFVVLVRELVSRIADLREKLLGGKRVKEAASFMFVLRAPNYLGERWDTNMEPQIAMMEKAVGHAGAVADVKALTTADGVKRISITPTADFAVGELVEKADGEMETQPSSMFVIPELPRGRELLLNVLTGCRRGGTRTTSASRGGPV